MRHHAIGLFFSLIIAACGLTPREAVTAGLESANAAIVSAAHSVDAIERERESRCIPLPPGKYEPCVTDARRLNAVLDAYNNYAIAWAALVAIWNSGTGNEPQARAEVESAAAAFWAAKASVK